MWYTANVSDAFVELYHVSEEPGIRVFEPRPSASGPEPVVWAIDGEHLPNYLLPRDCPRVAFCAGAETTTEDAARFLPDVERVVAIEASWLRRVVDAKLVRYTFARERFALQDPTAGYYVSTDAVSPASEEPLDDLSAELLSSGVELRVLPSLWMLRERVIHSTLSYSIIRMRNASPPAEGYDAYHPLPGG